MAKLGELYKITSGGTPSRNHSEYYEDGTIPWVKTGDLKDKYLFETDEKISQLGLENSSARIYLKNTVLLAMYGATIGATSILKIDAATNQACAAFSPRENILPEYLYAFLESQKDRFIKDAVGGAQPNLSAGYLKNIEFDYPPLEQQTQITSTLNKIDKLLLLRKQQLAKLDELVKARFVEMFGEPIGNPMGWPVNHLVEISQLITNGNTPKGGSENYVETGIAFLRSQNVWRNRIDLSDVVYIDEDTHRAMKKSSVCHNDILITKTGRINTENSSLGRAALFQGKDNSANINGHVYLVRLKEGVNPRFVVTILTGEAYRKYIRKVCVGGIDKRQINLEQVEEFPIIKPPLLMQNDFATFVERVDQQKQTVQQSLEKLELMKKALMQEYFG